MSTQSNVDYSQIPVIEVARSLFGQENRARSSKIERHFPDHGALFVNIAKNRWYSHVNAKGGDAIELVRHAQGCGFKEAIDWLSARGHDVGPRVNGSKPRQVVAEYDYVAAGSTLYQTVRYEPKDFRQRRPDGKGGWIWKGPELGLAVPYRLPELRESGDAPVLIAGAEKDVENLRALGFTATCNHGGEGKWWPELTPYFEGRRVGQPPSRFTAL